MVGGCGPAVASVRSVSFGVSFAGCPEKEAPARGTTAGGPTAVSRELVSIELLCNRHRGPAEISAVGEGGLAEGELRELAGTCGMREVIGGHFNVPLST